MCSVGVPTGSGQGAKGNEAGAKRAQTAAGMVLFLWGRTQFFAGTRFLFAGAGAFFCTEYTQKHPKSHFDIFCEFGIAFLSICA